MEIKEYINKNLPKLNWNILPQIFEENGVELTEEIKNYLKETPGNTNWNILRQLNQNDSNKEENEMIVYLARDGEYITNASFENEEMDFRNPEPQEIFAFCEAHNNNNIAKNITVMVFSSFPPVVSNYTFAKASNEWLWYGEGDHYFAVQSDGTWRFGSDN